MTASSTTLRRLVLIAAVAGLALTAAASPAAASSKAAPCWKKLITDWYDGRIDHSYPVHCYRDALKHLPQDVRTYSDAYDVISRALASATRDKKHVDQNALIAPPAGPGDGGTPPGGGGTPPGGGGKSGGKSGGGGTISGSGGNQQTDGASGSTAGGDGGFLNQAVGKLGSNRADSVPVPLIVLAALALLLVAAGGAGLLARRVQTRRARP